MLVLCEGAKPGGLVPDVDGALTDFSKEVGAPVGVGPRDAVDAFDVMCDADVLVGAARPSRRGVCGDDAAARDADLVRGGARLEILSRCGSKG